DRENAEKIFSWNSRSGKRRRKFAETFPGPGKSGENYSPEFPLRKNTEKICGGFSGFGKVRRKFPGLFPAPGKGAENLRSFFRDRENGEKIFSRFSRTRKNVGNQRGRKPCPESCIARATGLLL